jgi:hypothetical protein
MKDSEAIAAARAQVAKVRKWRDVPVKKRDPVAEYVVLPFEVVERLLAIAEARTRKSKRIEL